MNNDANTVGYEMTWHADSSFWIEQHSLMQKSRDEARRFARHFYRQFQQMLKECEILKAQLTETQDDLEIARAGIDEIVAYAQYDPCNDEYPVKVARETKDKINKRHT